MGPERGRGFEKIQGVTPPDWTHRSPDSSGLGRSRGLQTDFIQGTLRSGELFCRNPTSHVIMSADLPLSADSRARAVAFEEMKLSFGDRKRVSGCLGGDRSKGLRGNLLGG